MRFEEKKTNNGRYSIRFYRDCGLAELIDKKSKKKPYIGTIRDVNMRASILGLRVIE